MANVRIEAEQMTLTGYTAENSSPSSGGKVINVGNGDGVASTRFAGAAGTYDFEVVYHDENDGQSSLAVWVDGVSIDSWVLDEATDSTIATVGNRRARVIAGVVLKANSLVEIRGSYDAGEYSRVDYLDIAPSLIAPQPIQVPPSAPTVPPLVVVAPPSNPPSATGSTTGVGKLEAEQMTLVGYTPENSSPSSGGKVINVGEGSGTATTTFTGAAGRYNLTVAYHDENDGASALSVKVDGVVVDSWTLNEATDSTIASSGNLRSRAISVDLNPNSVIEIQGASNQMEYSRVDYINIAASNSTPPPVTPPVTPGGISSTVGIGRIEAEQMTLAGYTPENSSASSGGKVINVGEGSGTAAARFTAATGRYDLKVVYHDENDGQSSLAVTVDGVTVDSWTLNEATDSSIATVGNRRERVISNLNLNTDSVIEIRGASNQMEYSRVDYLEVAAAGSTTPPPSGSAKLRVLPLGDSNTKGQGTPGGYRIKFWERAVNDGLNIDFLGTRNNGPSRLGDGDHQGQGGWSIPQMTSWVRSGNLAAQNPDIILFMMGTNDANTNGGVKGPEIRDRLSTLIDEVAKATPLAHLFVSSILPLDTPKGTAIEAKSARDFNALIPNLVQEKANQGKRVSFVDAGGSLGVGDINGDNSTTNDEDDGLHATAAGYDKLGDAWYNGVSQSSAWINAIAAKNGSQSGSQNNNQNASSIFVQSDSLVAPSQPASLTASLTTTGNQRDNLLEGGSGPDTLTGGGGADTFIYRRYSDGLDRITDFSRNDLIQISASGFGGGLVEGTQLSKSTYRYGFTPSTVLGQATFLYSKVSNVLSFDADGTGSGSAVDIATFSNGFMPQSNQIKIVA